MRNEYQPPKTQLNSEPFFTHTHIKVIYVHRVGNPTGIN